MEIMEWNYILYLFYYPNDACLSGFISWIWSINLQVICLFKSSHNHFLDFFFSIVRKISTEKNKDSQLHSKIGACCFINSCR